jgi:hypothetical protein
MHEMGGVSSAHGIDEQTYKILLRKSEENKSLQKHRGYRTIILK